MSAFGASRAQAALVGGLVLTAVLLVADRAPAAAQEDPFPHEAHAGLFPVCTGCHEGAEDGNVERLYPPPAQCVGCHDGVDEETVDWEEPSRVPSNVVFDHGGHDTLLQEAGDPAQSCEERLSAYIGRKVVGEDIAHTARLTGTDGLSCHGHPIPVSQ